MGGADRFGGVSCSEERTVRGVFRVGEVRAASGYPAADRPVLHPVPGRCGWDAYQVPGRRAVLVTHEGPDGRQKSADGYLGNGTGKRSLQGEEIPSRFRMIRLITAGTRNTPLLVNSGTPLVEWTPKHLHTPPDDLTGTDRQEWFNERAEYQWVVIQHYPDGRKN